MTETISQQPVIAAPCPSWCTGRHAHFPGDGPEYARFRHLAASCPSWCLGHPGDRDPVIEAVHAGPLLELRLSLAEPYEQGVGGLAPDYVGVSMWQDPEYPQCPAGTVSLMHGATDHFVPDMTPQEAVALAAALVQTACRVQPGAVEAIAAPGAPRHQDGACPPWCAYGPHDPGDDTHLSEGHAVPAASPRHLCSYTKSPKPESPGGCGHDICAELVLSEDGLPQVTLHHGYGGDELPPMTPAAAEALAWKILGLVCTAREPVQS